MLLAEFFDNLDFSGEPSYVDYIDSTWVGWFGLIADDFDPTHFSLRISGSFSVPESGKYAFSYGLIGKSGKLQIGDTLVADLKQTKEALGSVPDYLTYSFEMELEAGREYSLQMEYVTIPDIQWRAMSLGAEWLDGPDPVAEAVELAKRAEKVVIVAGLNKDWEAEGNDRVNMRLPNRQDELIEKVAAVNSNVVVVLNLGSPVEMPWLDKVSAVLHMWYLGQETGNALADILYGDTSPSGKLATTFPKRLEDNPSYINFPGENGHVNYGEGIFVGYRYYDHIDLDPLFPFGFGLSYTEFGYKSLSMPESAKQGETVRVSCEVENLGEMAGKEVVQLYVRDIESSLVRPPKELKAFKKVMLQPGETITVEFELNQRSLAFYDDAKAEWVAEPGDFEILIGSSSRHIYVKGMLKLGE